MKKLVFVILSLAVLSLSACIGISDTGNSLTGNSNTMNRPEDTPAQLPTGSVPPYSYSFNNADGLLNWLVAEDKSDIWEDLITTIQNQGYIITVNELSGELTLDLITIGPDLRFIRYAFTHITNDDRVEVDIHLTDQPLDQFVSDFIGRGQEVAVQITKTSNVQYESSTDTELFYYDAFSPPREGHTQMHSVTMAFFELDDTIITIGISRLSTDIAMNVTWDNDYLELFKFSKQPISILR